MVGLWHVHKPIFTQRIGLRFGISVESLGLNVEVQRAWGLTGGSFIVIHLTLPSQYLTDLCQTKEAVAVEIGLQDHLDTTPLTPFLLQWSLAKWLLNDIKTMPPQVGVKAMAHHIYTEKEVESMVDALEITDAQARLRLMRANGNQDRALSSYFEDTSMLEPTLEDRRRIRCCNPLLQLLDRLVYRLKHSNKHCMQCSVNILVPSLKPTICAAALCRMRLEEFGWAVNLESEIINHPKVCDLLISMTCAAVEQKFLGVQSSDPSNDTMSHQRVSKKTGKPLLSASHSGVEPSHICELYDLNAETDKPELNYDRLLETLNMVPGIDELTRFCHNHTLLKFLNTINPLLVPVLRWVFSSNRAYLRELEPHEQVSSLKTQHQFILLNCTPEHEHEFQASKRQLQLSHPEKPSSIYAFHGSDTKKWHSILRSNVKNMSNTKYMSTGAAYGQGIYLSPDSSVSMAYCKGTGGWKQSMFGDKIKCLSLCEVINNVSPPNPHYVVPDEKKVTTRYLMVYPSACNDRVVVKDILNQLPPLEGHCATGDITHDLASQEPTWHIEDKPATPQKKRPRPRSGVVKRTSSDARTIQEILSPTRSSPIDIGGKRRR